MQRAAGGRQLIDALADGRVFDQRRGVVRLDAGVDHQRAAAAPMLVRDKTADAVDVGRRIAARERRPEKIVQRSAANSLSSTTTTSGKRLSGWATSIAAQNRRPRPVRLRSRRVRQTAALRRPGCPAGRAAGRENRSGKRQAVQIGRQAAPRRAGRGDHHLRALVQPAARVVERVDRGAGLKVQVAPPIDPLQRRAEETRRRRGRPAADCPRRRRSTDTWPATTAPGPAGVGQGEQFPRPRRLGVGHVPLAADGQQQRMHAGRVDGVDRLHAGNDRRESPARPTRGSIGRTSCLLAAAGRRP